MVYYNVPATPITSINPGKIGNDMSYIGTHGEGKPAVITGIEIKNNKISVNGLKVDIGTVKDQQKLRDLMEKSGYSIPAGTSGAEVVRMYWSLPYKEQKRIQISSSKWGGTMAALGPIASVAESPELAPVAVLALLAVAGY
jgi:hypothetical protein